MLKMVRNRQYPAENIMVTDYADDIALLANTPTQDKSLLHSLEQAAGGIGLYVNTNKNGIHEFESGKSHVHS